MSDPMFVMSMYANKTDLYEAKAKYYMEKSHKLEAENVMLKDFNMMLKDFEKRRVYASPERWKQLQGYEATITELESDYSILNKMYSDNQATITELKEQVKNIQIVYETIDLNACVMKPSNLFRLTEAIYPKEKTDD